MMKKGGVLYFEMVEKLLEADEKIMYVSLIDSKGNKIMEKFKPQIQESLCNASSEYVLDLCITKQMLDVFNEPFGHPVSVLIKREKTQQIIFYHDFLIIYVICDTDTSERKMAEISEKISPLVRKLIAKPP